MAKLAAFVIAVLLCVLLSNAAPSQESRQLEKREANPEPHHRRKSVIKIYERGYGGKRKFVQKYYDNGPVGGPIGLVGGGGGAGSSSFSQASSFSSSFSSPLGSFSSSSAQSSAAAGGGKR